MITSCDGPLCIPGNQIMMHLHFSSYTLLLHLPVKQNKPKDRRNFKTCLTHTTLGGDIFKSYTDPRADIPPTVIIVYVEAVIVSTTLTHWQLCVKTKPWEDSTQSPGDHWSRSTVEDRDVHTAHSRAASCPPTRTASSTCVKPAEAETSLPDKSPPAWQLCCGAHQQRLVHETKSTRSPAARMLG